MRFWYVAVFMMFFGGTGISPAQAPSVLAPRPPMGWNSWDAYGLTITEAQFRENVNVLAAKLKPFGWQYAVIDEGWFLKNPHDLKPPGKAIYEIDANGRYNPVPERFPSAVVDGKNQGFRALGDYVHAQGLKFGIHIVRGIPREAVRQDLPVAGSRFHARDVADTTDACPWDPTNWGVRDTPAGQAWYDALLAQYADWGVDFLKVDCISDHPYKPAEIHMIHNAIVKTGRPIILSLSPGPTSPGIVNELIPYAQMWRISDDVWDFWKNLRHAPRSVHDQFELAAAWAPYAHAGAWPDADMLPVGYLGPEPGDGEARPTRLTPGEQRSMVTLWAMMRSPLIIGANLTRLDEWTTGLLTNADVIAVDQYAHDQRQVAREGDTVAWTALGRNGVRYLALFNLNDGNKTIARSYGFYNLPPGSYSSRELWSNEARVRSDSINVTLPAHGCILLELKR
ncbi:Alpha galactosidase A [Bryocella elongata]|uniref:Alpha-galactosidase n=1 Tax=Bryocella elongata TaxID=863522 RepID=A0A1H5UTA1_9BACT|nr:glycoside hydrolase family 27 protein [Bryocella elongata]SEF77658.1 Alpha galactosidase A [Bryocella elongata]